MRHPRRHGSIDPQLDRSHQFLKQDGPGARVGAQNIAPASDAQRESLPSRWRSDASTAPSKSVKVAETIRDFRTQTVTRAVYATGWDGTVRVVAKAANDITVFREH